MFLDHHPYNSLHHHNYKMPFANYSLFKDEQELSHLTGTSEKKYIKIVLINEFNFNLLKIH